MSARRGPRPWMRVALLLLAAAGASGAAAPEEPAARRAWVPAAGLESLLAGFRAHAVPLLGGLVDWTDGVIRAEGRGVADGNGPDDQLAARRAALEAARRNAIAVTSGIRLDGSRTVADVADGVLRVQGRVRRFREVDESWDPSATPPEYRITIEVPLWGVHGVAELFRADQQALAREASRWDLEARRPRPAPEPDRAPPPADEDAEEVVVVDARGLDVEASVFPAVADTGGKVLHDVRTVEDPDVPVARFVETDLPFEALISFLRWDALVLPASARLPQDDGSKEDDSRRRPKRTRAVRAVAASGEAKATLVIAAEDAAKLASLPAAAEALRKGRVLIVTDAAAAGTEGRLRTPGDRLVASGRAPAGPPEGSEGWKASSSSGRR